MASPPRPSLGHHAVKPQEIISCACLELLDPSKLSTFDVFGAFCCCLKLFMVSTGSFVMLIYAVSNVWPCR